VEFKQPEPLHNRHDCEQRDPAAAQDLLWIFLEPALFLR